MDIFESLENLQVSEGCFEDIISIVEALLSEGLNKETIKSYIQKRDDQAKEAEKDFLRNRAQGTATREMLDNYLKKVSKAQYAKTKGGQALRYSAAERHRSKKNMEEQAAKSGN